MIQKHIDELQDKVFVNNDSLLELDKLLEDIIAYLTDSYKSHEEANSVKIITDNIEACRVKDVEYLKPENRTIEEETFYFRKDSALTYLQGFIRLGRAGDIVGSDS